MTEVLLHPGHGHYSPGAGRNQTCASSWRSAWLLGLTGSLLIGGCTTMPADARKDADYQQRAYAADRPTVRPVRSVSSFSDSLACMDHMLRAAQLPTTLITSKQIPDYSARVSVATKDMVITALSQMSRLSNAFRFVDYEVDITRQDTVQNLTTILLNNNQMQLQRPALYLSGAIAYVDQNVLNNNMDAGISGPRIDLGYSRNRNASIIGLEMHLGDFRTRTLIPGMDSANEVIVGVGGHGVDVAGRIGTYGVQFNVGRDYTQGAGAAVRTLVELATIELVGKWARVPYWQCLTLEQTHPDFQRQLQDWYDETAPAVRNQLVRRSLTTRGYLTPGDSALTDDEPELRTAVARFQADQGMVVHGSIDFRTYERSLRHFVALGPQGELTRIGWATNTATPVTITAGAAAREGTATAASAATAGTQGTGLSYGGPAPGVAIDLQIENVMLDRNAFQVGEQIFLSATVSRASYLSCYMGNASGSVIRLLPNHTNTTGAVSANQAVRIPDWMTPHPGFVMDAGSPGSEGVACFATPGDSFARLPEALRGEPFKALPGFPTLESVNVAYAQALGADQYHGSALHWQVIPRTAAPAQPRPSASPAAAPATAGKLPVK